MNLAFTSAHTLKIDVCPSMEPVLDDCLKHFWNLESLSIVKEEASVYEKFVKEIKFEVQSLFTMEGMSPTSS